MRIDVDQEACTGHGRCYTLAPEVFECDDDGYCLPSDTEVPAELEAQARRGVAGCPERALTIRGG